MSYRAVFLSAIVFILLSGPVESLVARHISADLQYRLTILFCLVSGLGLSTYALWKHKPAFLNALKSAWPILGFAIVAMASTAWSISPSSTIMASIALTFFALALISVCAMTTWREILAGILFATIFIGFLSILLIPIGGLMVDIHEGALRGPYGEKNRAGAVFAIGAVTAMGLAFIDRKLSWLIWLPFFLVLLFLTKSGTATLAAGLGVAAFAYGEILKGRPRRLIFGSWFGIIAAVGIGFIVVTNAETLLDLAGEDSTFTGRDQIWPSVLWRIREAPLLGYGYDAFWRLGNVGMDWLWYEAGFEVYNAHNGWLETMLGLGLAGTVFLFWMTARTGIAGLVALNGENDARRFALPAIMMIVMMSLTESAIGGPEGPAWLLLLLIATKTGMSEEIPRSRQRPTRPQSTSFLH
jgi:O-antigen ligase